MNLTHRFSCLLLVFAVPGPALAADCNQNGREDDLEIAGGESPDCNRNGVPDDCDLGPVNLGLARRAAVDTPYSFFAAKPADLDGDADLDLATILSFFPIMVLLNSGEGGFEPTSYPSRGSPRDLAAADLDGDGDVDLATSCVSLYFNDGRGEFSAETTQEVVGAQSLVPIDLDGDGLLDLATADWELKTVSFLLNRAGGNFSAPVHLALAEMPRLVLSGDLDEDGDGDLIAAAASDAWLFQNEGGTLSAPRKLGVDYNLGGGLAADLDSDGRLDLAFTQIEALRVLRNRGNATFELRHHPFTGDGAFEAFGRQLSISGGDLDGDRNLDLIFTGTGPHFYGAVALLRNRGGGSFDSGRLLLDTRSEPALVVAADFGNGPEVLVSPFRLDNAAILSPTPVPLSRDCNLNTIPDECDPAGETILDCDRDGVPDDCHPNCEPPAGHFRLGFEGLPPVLYGAPGEVKTLEVFPTLTSVIPSSTDGPEGWSISMFVKGAHPDHITVKGVHVSTIFDEDGDDADGDGRIDLGLPGRGGPATPLVDPFDLDLKDAGFKVAQKAFAPGGFEGAVSAIVLHQTQKMVLHPNGTERIAKLTLEGVIPEGRECAPFEIRFRNGLNAVRYTNVITFQGAPVRPDVEHLTVLLCPVEPFIRCDPNNDGTSDLGDAIWLFGELFIPEGAPVTACPQSADCNGDGAEDISDPIYALAFQFLGGPAPPPPFPACGVVEPGALPCPFGSTGCWP